MFRTGNMNDDGNFPFEMEYVTSNRTSGKKIVPDGTIFYGIGDSKGMPKLDSISADGLTEDHKQLLLTTIESTFSQVKFPDKKIKIGETFVQEMPLSIPVADVNLDMAITSTYKLISIKEGFAFFDISIDFSLLSEITKYTIKATGTGNGSIKYDLKNNFFIEYKTTTEMKMNFDVGSFVMDMTVISYMDQNTTLYKK